MPTALLASTYGLSFWLPLAAGAIVLGFGVWLGCDEGKATSGTSQSLEEVLRRIAFEKSVDPVLVQDQTKQTVDVIKNIGSVIAQVREISSAIVAGTELPGATTRDIAERVRSVADGTRTVAANIEAVALASSRSGDMAGTVLTPASGRSERLGLLETKVTAYIADGRR